MLSRDEFIYTGHVTPSKEDSRFRLAQLTGERPTILDAGCAVGYIGEFLRGIPPKRWLAGIELDPGAAEKAGPHYDQMIVGSLEDEKVWVQLERKVDAMIFGDVLEHTTDPIRVLRMAEPHLKDDGVVIISMPNIAHLKIRLRMLAGRFEYEEWGIMDRTHLRFFTLASAKRMLRAAGFVVMHTEPILAFPPPTGGSAIRRFGRGAKTRVRFAIGSAWPTLLAKQFIFVGTQKQGRSTDRVEPMAASVSK